MLEFKTPELSDKDWVKKIMWESHNIACESCFGNLYIWSSIYGNKIAKYNDFFLSKYQTDKTVYYYPCGKGDIKLVIETLINDCKGDCCPFEMYGLTADKVRELDEIMPGKFNFFPMRDSFDYVYRTDDLALLKGRKYHSKRNHISYFKNNLSWEYEKIDDGNIEECLKMNSLWEKQNIDKNEEELSNELIAINRAFKNYDYLEFTGGLLRVDGDVVAYTLGEALNPKVFCTHIEKAFSQIRGAYPTINQQFAENELSSYLYVNREEDTGDEGLRTAKKSYYPTLLVEKYRAIIKG